MPFALLVLSGDGHGPAIYRRDRRGAGLPAGRRRPAHDADRRPRAGHRPRPGRRAAARRGPALRDAAGRHGGQRARLRRAAGRFQQDPADPGDPGRGRCSPWCSTSSRCGSRRRAIRRAPRPTAPRPSFREAWRALRRRRPREPAAGRGRPRHGRLQHAGHPARALWRRDPAASSVGATTALTALLAGGSLVGFALAARAARPRRRSLPARRLRRALGVLAFAAVILAAPLELARPVPHRHPADRLRRRPVRGRHADGGDGARATAARAAWRSAPGARCRRRPPASPSRSAASCATSSPASPQRVRSGPALVGPATGYGVVYHLEIVLLFATLVAIGPLVRSAGERRQQSPARFGLAEFPG